MSASTPFALLENAAALPWAAVPAWSPASFARAAAAELGRGARLCAWFGVPEENGISLVAVLAFDADHKLAVGRSVPFRGGYPAVTATQTEAHLFEREVWEQHGLVPEGHPWLKSVRSTQRDAPAQKDFFRVDGPEIHEVAVGPVHAGIIEPGHFRFQCHGEEVIHLEIALGYQHRGLENAWIGGPHPATPLQMETLAGDSSIAHATAYAQVMEALAGQEPPLRGAWLRAIGLELERLANHTGDIGALAGDLAFQPTAAACGKLRGDFLNLTALLCGNRFGRGWVRPGGSRFDPDASRIDTLRERLRVALAETAQAVAWFRDSASVRSRVEHTGVVTKAQAAATGLVGLAARASGLPRDVRQSHPTGWFRHAGVSATTLPGGDVAARARLRALEIAGSGTFLLESLEQRPGRAATVPVAAPRADMLAVSLVEGWRGEACHVALTGPDGRFRRYKVTDPSFHNWAGLALAMRGAAIADFPLCNKSFNLSYCGFDL